MSKRQNRRNRRRQRPQASRNGKKPAKDVDIVIPVYGGGEFLLDCLRTLYETDAGADYNVIVVDDQSPQDPKLKMALEFAIVNEALVFQHKENAGFAASCNSGARAGKSPWILFLNSDTRIIHEGWLGEMLAPGEDPEVGIVGALLTFYQSPKAWAPANPRKRPAGKVQHAGVVFDILGRPYHIFSGWDPAHPKVNKLREMNCVTGACLLTRRAVFKQIGGFNEAYTRGNFEDVHYCLEARMLGHRVVWTPKAHVEHYAGGSGNSMTAQKNAQLFQTMMSQYVAYDEWAYW